MLLHDRLKNYRLILASASPRRRELLADCDLDFVLAEKFEIIATRNLEAKVVNLHVAIEVYECGTAELPYSAFAFTRSPRLWARMARLPFRLAMKPISITPLDVHSFLRPPAEALRFRRS